MSKIATFFPALSLGLSVGLSALALPAGTEDADMRKEKLFPVGDGVGLTHFRVVMPRILYRGGTEGPRAGGDGPRRPLQNQSLQALCKAGFSQAVYAYRTGWRGTENVNCAGNSLQYDYHQWDNRAALKKIFIKLQSSLKVRVRCTSIAGMACTLRVLSRRRRSLNFAVQRDGILAERQSTGTA